MYSLLVLIFVAAYTSYTYTAENNTYLSCSNLNDVMDQSCIDFDRFAGNYHYGNLSVVKGISTLQERYNQTWDLNQNLTYIYKTVTVLSDALEHITGNQSAALMELDLSTIDSDGEMMNFIVNNSAEFENPTMLSHACDTMASVTIDACFFETKISKCMNNLRSVIKNRNATVEDIYANIIAYFRTKVNIPFQSLNNKDMDDIRRLGTELQKTIEARNLSIPFANHINCIHQTSLEAELALKKLLELLQSSFAAYTRTLVNDTANNSDKNSNDSEVGQNTGKISPEVEAHNDTKLNNDTLHGTVLNTFIVQEIQGEGDEHLFKVVDKYATDDNEEEKNSVKGTSDVNKGARAPDSLPNSEQGPITTNPINQTSNVNHTNNSTQTFAVEEVQHNGDEYIFTVTPK